VNRFLEEIGYDESTTTAHTGSERDRGVAGPNRTKEVLANKLLTSSMTSNMQNILLNARFVIIE
jgi:hypothetical protein